FDYAAGRIFIKVQTTIICSFHTILLKGMLVSVNSSVRMVPKIGAVVLLL
ncbi:hypothetical protein KI387_002268, partial [Taxus chinensis]